jgi:transcriptional regulator with XRE-family HTH domain
MMHEQRRNDKMMPRLERYPAPCFGGRLSQFFGKLLPGEAVFPWRAKWIGVCDTALMEQPDAAPNGKHSEWNMEHFDPEAFVARLREIRKSTGLTGSEIAKQGGITKQTFSGYLHTGRLPSAEVLANWVFRLGISADWLLTGKGPHMLRVSQSEPDPLLASMAETAAQMRSQGSTDEDISRALTQMLQLALAARAEDGR